MATLTQAVEIGDSELHIDTPLAAGQVPGFVKIDDELLSVGGQNNTTGLILSLSEPAREAHDDGATVTYAGRPYDPTFKTALAGGEQTIRRLGPFTVNYNTATDIADFYIELADIVAGTSIITVDIYRTALWNSDSAELSVALIDSAGAAAEAQLTAADVKVGNSIVAGTLQRATITSFFRTARAIVDCKLAAYVTVEGTPTAGGVVVYALIAEPA